jgi:hypothetical protein
MQVPLGQQGAAMVYLVMFFKSVAWALAFWTGTRRELKGMLLSSAAITLCLTVTDELTIARDPAFSAIALTLLLYAIMSLMLFTIAWKLRHPAVSLACNLMGTLGAFAVVNFTIVFLRASLPL